MNKLYAKLVEIQNELKAPKNQYNSFGKYHYRSCEDILEVLKPLLKKHKATLTISDEIVQIGDRYYIKATAALYDIETADKIEVSAMAREEENKKGMDSSQVTGATSSYARKYALNGLFCIDDTKDADSMENKENKPEIAKTPQITKTIPSPAPVATTNQQATIKCLGKGCNARLTPEQANISAKNFRVPLCPECQKKV